MKHSLVLKLKAPIQSWGVSSRYEHRETHQAPTKSAIVGLLASAEGRRRTDPIEDLAELLFGVRIDQPGQVSHDFQTAIDWRKGPPGKITHRYFLEDAAFIAALQGPVSLLESLKAALLNPKYPLYLGRRSCPAAPDLVLGIREGDVDTVLRQEPWIAASWYRKTRPKQVRLPIYRDVLAGETTDERLPDNPVSFDQRHRQYNWREIRVPEPVLIDNPDGHEKADPFWEAVISQ